ncbi:ester cyclase [Algoriphagus sp. CAU 1675]|uniref:ester cyclase n=1 Tax=Algoriphagus sp. CAU 1675 TaxID=3032597 RepID=UPI0023DB7F75|nr:ester cyclase [Algoriphagus sp. CAU 1675]MDF2159373.1 ester cyclase [Algoriphagus sp. CAU 1675]
MEENNLLNLTPKNLALKWIEFYNSHNPENAASLYHENVTNIQLPYDKPIQGRESMRITYENIFKAFPDIRIEALNIVENGTWVVVEWNFSGTMKGEFAGYSPNNNKFDMRGCEIFQIENGKILIQHGYWDRDTMFNQLKLGKV